MDKSKRSGAYWRKLGFFTLISVLITIAGLTLYFSHSMAITLVHPARTQPTDTPSDRNIKNWEEVWFTSTDNIRLFGWFIPPDPEVDGATIIFIHGLYGNRGSYLGTAEIMHKYGYGALLIDLRNYGNSEGDFSTFGLNEVQDVQAAVSYLLTRPEVNPERIGVIGHSMGGGAAILAAAHIPEIHAVVAEATYTSLEDNLYNSLPVLTGLPAFPFAPLVIWFAEQEVGQDIFADVRPIDHIASIAPRPVLVIHGGRDALIPVEHAQSLYTAAREPKFLYIVSNATHANFYSAAPREYEKRLVEFFGEFLLYSNE